MRRRLLPESRLTDASMQLRLLLSQTEKGEAPSISTSNDLEQPKVSLTIDQLNALFSSQARSNASSPSQAKRPGLSQPVQVYLLLGQSNMLGFGRVEPGKRGPEGSLAYAVKEKGLYPYLVNDHGEWSIGHDVRDIRMVGSGVGGTRE